MSKGIDNQHRFQEELSGIQKFLHFHLTEEYMPEIPEAITAIIQLKRQLIGIHAKLDRRAAARLEAVVDAKLAETLSDVVE